MHQHKSGAASLFLVIILNIAITVGEFIAGIIGGSLALISDSLHNLSDVFSLFITYFGQKISHKKISEQKTYGYRRAEIIAALTNVVILMAVGGFLISEAIIRFSHPSKVTPDLIIWGGFASIIINTLSVIILHRDARHSLNIKSAYLHLFTDVLTSIAVVIGGIAIEITNFFKIDAFIAILISIFIMVTSLKMLGRILGILMQFAPPDFPVEKVEEIASQFREISNIHHLHIWQLNEREIHMEAHVDFRNDIPISKVSETISKLSNEIQRQLNIAHITLQPEYGTKDDKSLIIKELKDK